MDLRGITNSTEPHQSQAEATDLNFKVKAEYDQRVFSKVLHPQYAPRLWSLPKIATKAPEFTST